MRVPTVGTFDTPEILFHRRGTLGEGETRCKVSRTRSLLKSPKEILFTMC